MKTKFLTLVLGIAIAGATSVSQAQVTIGFGFDSCGYPGYYQTCPAYGPPEGIYLGGGDWGHGRQDFRGGSRSGQRSIRHGEQRRGGSHR